MSALDALVRELEAVVRALDSGEVEGTDAARLVERCADLAAQMGAELDRQSRRTPEAAREGQESLLP